MNTQFSFWTTVKPQLLKKVLLQGTALAGCGATILILAGILMPRNTLEIWGVYLFFLSAIFIAVGLVPYRRLQKLETNPDKITLSDDSVLHYHKGDRILFSIPLDHIQSLEWIEKKNIYGITLFLKNGQSKFLPFFSHRSFQELQEIIF